MSSATSTSPAAIILAAGLGKRMRSDLPKVLHEVGDRPMVCAVMNACREAGCEKIVLVVGYRRDLVIRVLGDEPGAEFAIQEEQLGTGHAVQMARENLKDALSADSARDVFVLAGDGPLLRGSTLTEILHRHRETDAAATLATSIVDNPKGYGRIARDSAGAFVGIVEEKDCTPEQRGISEVNPSYYCFRSDELFSALDRVEKNPNSGEFYVTDVPGILLADGKHVEVVPAVPPEDVLSINSPEQLQEVDRIFRSRGGGQPAAWGVSE